MFKPPQFSTRPLVQSHVVTVELSPRERILFICTANIDRSRTAEDMYRTLIRIRFPDVDRPIVDLDVEDRWHRGDPELIARLARRLRPHLGAPARDRKPGRAHNRGSEG
jgi:hypothetical protein